MKFDRLSSSISLNKNESPSIYMAVCMIESLFRDVEDAAGKDISHAAPGDEQLPTKLIWLARTILKIYGENSESFQRNQGRLETMMTKIREAETELAGQAQVAQRLAELQKKDAALEQRLIDAELQRQQAQALQDRCREAESQIRELEAFDPVQARQELRALETRVEQLSAQRGELRTALEDQNQRNSELAAECELLNKKHRDAKDRTTELEAQRHQAEADCAASRETLEACARELDALTAAKERLVEDVAENQLQLAQLQEENAVYRAQQLDPLVAQRLKQVEENQALKIRLDSKTLEWEKAIMERTKLKKQVEQAEKRAADSQAEVAQVRQRTEAAEAKAAALDRQKEEALTKLEALLREVEDCETDKLPELRSQIAGEEEKRQELLRSLEDLARQQKELDRDILRLQGQDENLKTQVAAQRQRRTELTGGIEARTQELEALKAKIRELEGKNVKEQEQTFLRQLEADARTLEEADRACKTLDRQIKEQQTQLQAAQAKESELRQLKRTLEDSTRECNDKLRALAPYKDTELRRQVQDLQSRQRLLTETHEKLDRSILMMQEVLDVPPENLTSDPDGLRNALKKCGEALNQLQQNLVHCANLTGSAIKPHVITEEN